MCMYNVAVIMSNMVYEMCQTRGVILTSYSDAAIEINCCSDGAPHIHTHRGVIHEVCPGSLTLSWLLLLSLDSQLMPGH